MFDVKPVIKKALHPMLYRAFYAHEIYVKPFGSILQIKVVSDEFYTTDKRSQAARLIDSAKESILKTAGPSYTSLSISVEKEPPFYEFSLPVFDGPDHEDETGDVNPNWPSKTGNPSGGGRGNNPPQR